MFSFRKKPTTPASGRAERPTPTAELPAQGPEAPAGVEHRRHYRVQRASAHPLGVGLRGPSGRIHAGDCIDVSFGGFCASFTLEQDPALEPGQEVEVGLKALSRPNGIRARAKVTSIAPDSDRVRYGLQFIDPTELFKQMDAFYARYFNRRRHVRVLPELSAQMNVRINWHGGSFESRVHDLSVGGMGIYVVPAQAHIMASTDRVTVTFRLPRSENVVTAKATIRQRSPFQKNVLLGLEFDEGGGIEQHRAELGHYLQERLRVIEQYNTVGIRRPA